MGDIRFIDRLIGEPERDVSTSRIQEIIGNLNGIIAVIAEQNQVVAILAEAHFIGFDIGEPESLCTLIVRHKVRTVPFGKDVGIVPFAAVELVIAGTAGQDIVAGIAVEFIIARTAIQDIVAGIAVEFVVACTAVQYVVLTIAVQDIVTGMTV